MEISNHKRPKGSGVTHGLFRYGAVLPLAAVFTIGLTFTMATLVAAEFTPQDKSETVSYEINPVVIDIPNPIRTVKLDPLKKVEVPPPAPRLPTEKASPQTQPIIEVKGKKDIFVPKRIDVGEVTKSVKINRELTPIRRIPPVFPRRFTTGDVSGYCRVRFDIAPKGNPVNVTVSLCTNQELKAPSVKSVMKWKYTPEIQNGRAVIRSGLETIIRFDLKDEGGEVLPLPKGY